MNLQRLWIQRGIFSTISKQQNIPTTEILNTLVLLYYHVLFQIESSLTIGPEPKVQEEVWTRSIPPYVVRIPDTTSYNGRYSRSSLTDDELVPPALPRQLEKPFLNQNHIQKDDQSVLPNPAHVLKTLIQY